MSHQVFSLRTCEQCGFLATTPRPSPDEIGRYYESPNYISHSNSTQGFQDRLYQWARRRALNQKRKAISTFKRGGELLDIGCGTGEFLGHMEAHGFRTQGVEPNSVARDQAKTQRKQRVAERLEELPSGASFDIITMWHVLEHVYDPAQTLHQLGGLLRPNGLLVLAVPDRESWDAQHYGPDWAAYDVPRHLSHFRRHDITQLTKDQGITTKKIAPMWMDALYIGMHSERYRGANPLMAMVKGFSMGTWSNVMAVTSSRPTSSSLFFAQKD